jgi:ubiquinone biosynthesis protein Coq4
MLYRLFAQYRAALLVLLTHHLLRRPDRLRYTVAELRAFPEGTVGHALCRFLDQKQLTLLPYYAKHDIKHILLGYDTTGEGEVCLQCCMLGNGHLSFPVLATVGFGLLTMPEHWRQFAMAYRRGRHMASLDHLDWLSLLPEQAEPLIHQFQYHKNV